MKEKHEQWLSSEMFFCQVGRCNRSIDGPRGGFKRKSDLARHCRKVHEREQLAKGCGDMLDAVDGGS